jgi:hypothetical protein
MRESINDSEELKAVTPKARYALTYAPVEMVIGASAFALLLKVYSGGPRDILCLAAGWMSGGRWIVASRRERNGDEFRCEGVSNYVCRSPAVF